MLLPPNSLYADSHGRDFGVKVMVRVRARVQVAVGVQMMIL
jgi:hypothetical protein